MLQSQSTLERKKKTLSFSRKFPFMKSREDGKSEDGSDQERKFFFYYSSYLTSYYNNIINEKVYIDRCLLESVPLAGERMKKK